MRAHPIILAATLLALAATAQGAADPKNPTACSGEACTELAVSADGCTWKNASQRAIRFSLISGSTALVTTVLAPGEAFKQTNKANCVTEKESATKYQAAFVTLRQMPDEPAEKIATKIAVPRAKPAATIAAVPAGPVTLASAPIPRQKPASQIVPRSKPEAPIVASLVQPTAPLPAQLALAPDAANPCGDACAEILFKVVDDCLWVQSQNPKAIMFQATVAGRMVVLALEGANGSKADGKAPPNNAAAYHARQRDPFQSSSPGIPVFRARLGGCVKDRSQITHFVAAYAH